MYRFRNLGIILKISIFATGFAGIVAEFVLSTIATYLIGNAIFQWTIVMSLMLFAMGIGSRITRFFRFRLLDIFILTELALSVLCAISAQLAYILAAFTKYTNFAIYVQAILEIPLVIRINEKYEELRVNIASVMEKDYFGALFGGVVFAFFALPHLGLTYTPMLLGMINFIIASLLMWQFFHLIEKKGLLTGLFSFVFIFFVLLSVFAKPVIRYGEQRKYRDKIIYSKQTMYQKIVVTQWKNYYWLYINGQEQFSTFDEEKYHEPLVHPAMKLSPYINNVLILGGGDGLALREVLKYHEVKSVTLVDIDPVMTTLAKEHPVLLTINDGSMQSPKVKIINEDAAKFLDEDTSLYGVIIIDLPDPDTIDLMHVYSEMFYTAIRHHLIRGGVMVTQATSPYFSKKAFLCIMKTIGKAGYSVLPYHNQIPTLGEWGWVIGIKETDIKEKQIKEMLLKKDFTDIKTRYINKDAMISMAHFGKGVIDKRALEKIEVNTELNPVLHRYYLSGSWGMY
ncbi:MAG: polyamine aminopropyltransferase [Desulfobacterales bacterium]